MDGVDRADFARLIGDFIHQCQRLLLVRNGKVDADDAECGKTLQRALQQFGRDAKGYVNLGQSKASECGVMHLRRLAVVYRIPEHTQNSRFTLYERRRPVSSAGAA